MLMPTTTKRWDVFCTVVDNFGDIGICWRLSRQLAKEHHIAVRLWVDDLVSFAKICPQLDITLTTQHIAGVSICLWSAQTNWQQSVVADVVIEALACTIPLLYQQRMTAQAVKPLWINVEYLSAESWVEGCHGLASPQPQLALDKYFFFPGFTKATGGLLQERNLRQQAEQFMASTSLQQAFWRELGVANSNNYALKISLFAYDHPQLASLIACWQNDAQPILCLVPEGALAQQLVSLYPALQHQGDITLGALRLKLLPFMAQDNYDRLLWACDINFVRGEDSIIRAHWAAKPFVWQIYRQAELTHLDKLNAFMQRYCEKMPVDMAKTLQEFWLAWNADRLLADNWQRFSAILPQIAEYNQEWYAKLTTNGDLSSNLVHFVEKKFIIRHNFS